MRILKPCGTHAAYVRHLSHGEVPCDSCRVASNEYVNNNERGRVYRRAYHRALGRLRDLYPQEFDALLAEEREREVTGGAK